MPQIGSVIRLAEHMPAAEWTDPERAERWLRRRAEIPRSAEVAAVVWENVIAGRRLDRILDLGTGDGRAIASPLQAFRRQRRWAWISHRRC